MKHGYRKKSIWYKERITDPRQIISEFFIYSDLEFYRKTIRQVVRLVSSKRIWTKSEPGELVDEFKWLESVINAAVSEIRQNFTPSFLTVKEYGNPYRVFKRFFRCRSLGNWKQELQGLLDHCIRSTSIMEEEEKAVEIIGLYFYLTKMVEAGYLIELREKVGGGAK